MRLRRETSCWQQDIKKKEYGYGIGKATAVTCLIAWLYYRTMWACVFLFPVWLWQFRMWQSECIEKKRQEFQLQFKDAIHSLSSAIYVGYSVENAWREVYKELALIYEKESRIMRELNMITVQTRMNVSMEHVLEEFAERVESEDARSFAAVFVMAKKSGGNMITIIRDAANQIGDKIDVRREIDTILASKKYEFKVMTAIPYLIIGYMSVSFPEFMRGLYGNMIGAGVMTICLGIYVVAYYLGVKIINIEV